MRRAGSLRGFTLIELAVVLAIVGLLLGAILSPLATQLKVRKNRDAERLLRHTTEALVGYVIANGRLPCPDTDAAPDGLENTAGGHCSADPDTGNVGDFAVGVLPWVDLDAEPLDPWGRLIYYGVTDEFTYQALTGQPGAPFQLDLGDVGVGVVNTPNLEDLAAKVPGTNVSQAAPAIVFSTGANGHGGRYLDGAAVIAVPAGTDEAENLDGDATVVRRTHTGTAAACDDLTNGAAPCEFDDVVTWISGARIIGLMVQAGQLP